MKTLEEEVITLLATSNPFQQWLIGFEPDGIVGLAGSCTSCPIAKFVCEKGINIQVLPELLLVYRNKFCKAIVIEDLPDLQWVIDFILLIDTTTISDTVTSTMALNVLETLQL